MLRRTVLPALAVLIAASMTTVTVGTADGSESTPVTDVDQPSDSQTKWMTTAGTEAPPGSDAGPPYDFVTELKRKGVALPLKDTAILIRTEHGYRFRTGQQDSHLVITLVDRGLRFVDTGTKSFRQLSPDCQRKKVRVGISAVCQVPGSISVPLPLLVEVWPRLGNDFTDTSTLPATFAVAVLSDKGNDVAHFGAGPDFFNGFSGRDLIWGGAGNDWIRAGLDNDTVEGGPGNDDLVAGEGSDNVHGGDGDDRVGGGDGDDRLWGDAGADFILCGTGSDTTNVDSSDRVFYDCE